MVVDRHRVDRRPANLANVGHDVEKKTRANHAAGHPFAVFGRKGRRAFGLIGRM